MNATTILRRGTTLATAPLALARSVNTAATRARSHPTSTELRALLDDGFTVAAYRSGHDGVTVTMQRGSETRRVSSADLAFGAYAAQKVPRAVAARLEDERRRVLGS